MVQYNIEYKKFLKCVEHRILFWSFGIYKRANGQSSLCSAHGHNNQQMYISFGLH